MHSDVVHSVGSIITGSLQTIAMVLISRLVAGGVGIVLGLATYVPFACTIHYSSQLLWHVNEHYCQLCIVVKLFIMHFSCMQLLCIY